MRTVLCRTAGRASLILATAGVVGSAALPAVPAAAGAANNRASVHHAAPAAHHTDRSGTQIGTAVKYVRNSDGSISQVR
ncbi:MAG: hypothetical protein JO079_11495 [Frankiaceae bacterium]|nr:hypothetical protein [Frankiaceae bacterium]